MRLIIRWDKKIDNQINSRRKFRTGYSTYWNEFYYDLAWTKLEGITMFTSKYKCTTTKWLINDNYWIYNLNLRVPYYDHYMDLTLY